MSRSQKDEGYYVAIHTIFTDDIQQAEIRLIESQLGELLQQIIRDEDQEK